MVTDDLEAMRGLTRRSSGREASRSEDLDSESDDRVDLAVAGRSGHGIKIVVGPNLEREARALGTDAGQSPDNPGGRVDGHRVGAIVAGPVLPIETPQVEVDPLEDGGPAHRDRGRCRL